MSSQTRLRLPVPHSPGGDAPLPAPLTSLIAHVRTPLYRNGYALILSALSTGGLGIVYWAVAARYYSTRDLGLNSAAISAMMLVSGITQLDLGHALIRFVPTAGQTMARFIARTYAVTLLAGVLLGGGLVALRGVWSPFPELFKGNTPFLLWFLIAALAWNIFALQDFVLPALRQAQWVPFENIIFAVVKIFLLVLFAGALPRFGIFLSWTIPTLGAIVAVNILIFVRLIPRRVAEVRERTESILPRQIVHFVAGNYLGFLFFLISGTILPILVKIENGPKDAAFLYLPWVIAYSFQLVAQNMTSSLTVEGAINQARLQEYSDRVLLNTARLVVPLVAVCVLFAPFILRIFGPDYSVHGTDTLRLLAVAAVPNIVCVVYVTIARVQRRNGTVAVVQGVLCALSLGLAVLFLRRYGIAGVGLAWVIAQTLMAAALLVLRRSLFSGSKAEANGWDDDATAVNLLRDELPTPITVPPVIGTWVIEER